MRGVDWRMGRGKRAYGTYREGGTGKGKIIWNVNKEYRKLNKNRYLICRLYDIQLLKG